MPFSIELTALHHLTTQAFQIWYFLTVGAELKQQSGRIKLF